jgi:hypothetical protein
MPIWVVIMTRMQGSSHKKTCMTLLRKQELENKNHFFRIRNRILLDNVPENTVEFLRPDENMTAMDMAMRDREERLLRKMDIMLSKAGI